MATIVPVYAKVAPGVIQVLWEAITPTDKPGAAFTDEHGCPSYPVKSIQIIGAIGSSMDLNIEGSNDNGTTWASLEDINGTSLDALGALGIWQIAQNPMQIRPILIAGTSQDLDIYLIAMNPHFTR